MKSSINLILMTSLLLYVGCKERSKKVEPPNVGIHSAVIMGDTEAIQQHIEAGTDINEDEWTHGSSPLITAAAFGEIEVAKLLINAGAELNFQNDERSTPLITAIVFKNTDIAQLLIDSGADVNIKNNDGSTALIVASLYCYADIVKALLAKGANKEVKNIYGRSALSVVENPFEELREVYKKLEEGLKI